MAYHNRFYAIPKWLLIVFTGVVLALAAYLPITQDEAYYFNWAKYPALGYFDHPPAVAFLSLLSQLIDSNHFFKGRFFSCLLASASLFFLFRLYSLYGFKKRSDFVVTCVLAAGNFAAIASGILTTPDTVLMFSWSLALHEAAHALKGSHKRWLSAGIAVGVGLLSKYTMVIIGPVFLISILRSRPEHLLKPWPYLGGLLALIIFTPNLFWNSQNDWVSFRFQLKHGLAMERANIVSGLLPVAERPGLESSERQLEKSFQLLDPDLLASLKGSGERTLLNRAIDPPHQSPLNQFFARLKEFSRGENLPSRLGDFFAGQLAFFGFLLFPLLLGLAFRLRRRVEPFACDPLISPLINAAFLVPLLVFASFALNAKVEANWAAMSIIGAAPILQRFGRVNLGLALTAGLVNFVVLAAAVFHTLSPFAKVNPGLDRLMKETHGFANLAQAQPLVEEGRFFADRFQLVSLLRYYNPGLKVGQWPGVTRVSEYVRQAEVWDPFDHQELLDRGHFYLLSSEKIPPSIPGFSASDLIKIRDCKQGHLEFHQSWLSIEAGLCSQVHEWSWVRYRRDFAGVPVSIARY